MWQVHDPKVLSDALQHPMYQTWFGNEYNDRIEILYYQAGEIMLNQDERPRGLLLLLDGKVCVSAILPNGNKRIIKIQKAPMLFGEVELLELSPTTMLVQTLSPCYAILLPYALCRDSLLSDNAFLRRINNLISLKLRKGVLYIFRTLSYPLKNRLAKFVLEFQENDCFIVRKVDAADSLGVSYRHLSQVLGDFVKNGYLAKDGLKYTIIDKSALMDLAKQMDE